MLLVRYGDGMRISTVTRIAVTAVAGLAVTLPSLAEAGAPPVKNGYYASLAGVPSSDVEFTVRSEDSIPHLSLGCSPTDPGLTENTDVAGIAVHAPKLRIVDGRFSYHGPAEVTLDAAGEPKIAETTLDITAHHVNGPVRHYTYQGQHLQETTAWKGTATSPACTNLPRHDAFTLFGPIAGE